jgi:hypothetical protein
MAIYPNRDVQSGDDGDIVISEAGDLAISESTDTAKQLLKMVIATDANEMDTLPQFGANIGTLIGKSMREVIDRLPILIRDGVRRTGYLDHGDVFVDAYPIDYDKVIVFVDFKGTFINSDGEEVVFPSNTLKFYFPYTEERIREWS